MNRFGWKRALKVADGVVGDGKRLRDVIEQATMKMFAHADALKTILDDLQTIFRLVRAWLKGEYRDVSKKSLVVLVGALIYFLMPFDAIPDFIPVIGLTDDVAIIAMALTAAKTEVEKFREWEGK